MIVVGDHRQRALRVLKSVLNQVAALDCEITLIDVTDGEFQPPSVPGKTPVHIQMASPNQTIGELRSNAVQTARGMIIAFLEDHVTIEPGYFRAVLDAFQDGCAAVGPTVQNANPDVGISNAVHLLHYGSWGPALEPGEVELLPGNNSAYRKSTLELYEHRLEHLLLTDTVLQMRLKSDKHRLYLEPRARLHHLNATSLRTAVVSEYLYHRCFVWSRGNEFNWTELDRLRVLLRTPLTPWIRLLRLAKLVRTRFPHMQQSFILALPSLVVLQHAAAWGQLVGLVSGPGTAPVQFTRFELEYPRPTASA